METFLKITLRNGWPTEIDPGLTPRNLPWQKIVGDCPPPGGKREWTEYSGPSSCPGRGLLELALTGLRYFSPFHKRSSTKAISAIHASQHSVFTQTFLAGLALAIAEGVSAFIISFIIFRDVGIITRAP